MHRTYRSSFALLALLVAICMEGTAAAQDSGEAPLGKGNAARVETPTATTAKGALVICGGGSFPQAVAERFVELAGGSKGTLVVIPTASSTLTAANRAALKRYWTDRGLGNVMILHTRDRAEADSTAFIAPLGQATAVWFEGGQQSRLAESYVGTATEQAISELYQRGGVVGGTSAGAAIQTRVMIQSGNPLPIVTTGLDLLPGAIVDQHFLRRNRFNRLLSAVREHPRLVGVGIDEATALVFQQGECVVLGDSYVTVIALQGEPTSLGVRTYHAEQTFRLGVSSQPTD